MIENPYESPMPCVDEELAAATLGRKVAMNIVIAPIVFAAIIAISHAVSLALIEDEGNRPQSSSYNDTPF